MNTNNIEARPRRSKRLPVAITGVALVLALGAGKEVINNRAEADKLTESAAGGSREAAVKTVDAASAYIARLARADDKDADDPGKARKQQASGRMVITTVCNPDDPKSYSFNTLEMTYDSETTKTADGSYVNTFEVEDIGSITVSRLANENNQTDQVIALNPDKRSVAYDAPEVYATAGNDVYSSEEARLHRLGPNQTGHLLNEDNDQPVLEHAIAVAEMIVAGDCSVPIPEPPVGGR